MKLSTIEGGAGTPPEPDWTVLYSDPLEVAAASEEWGAIIRELREAKALTVANGHACRRLVEFRIIYERAARQVAEHGPVTKAKRTRVPTWNLHWLAMKQASECIRALEAELGVAPTRRGKVAQAVRRKAKPKPSDVYLGKDGA